jgi:hypothetical protein
MSANHRPHHLPPAANTNRGAAPERDKFTSFWTSKAGLVTIGFVLVGAFFLLTEHRAHTFGFLPYLLILACPLMHIFMHRGHGGHDQDRGSASTNTDSREGA